MNLILIILLAEEGWGQDHHRCISSVLAHYNEGFDTKNPKNRHCKPNQMDDWMPMSVWVVFIVFYSGSIMIVIGS